MDIFHMLLHENYIVLYFKDIQPIIKAILIKKVNG